MESLAFYFLGLKLRRAIAHLPPGDLHLFLTETLFTGGLKTLASVLFVTFRTTKCMFENRSITLCGSTATCSTYISVYIIAWWLQKVALGSVKGELRRELHISLEKIATMDVTASEAFQGSLVGVTAACGGLLFALMGASSQGHETSGTFVKIVGSVGAAAATLR